MTHAIDFLRLALTGSYKLEVIAEVQSETHEASTRNLQYNGNVAHKICTAINEAMSYLKTNEDAYRVRIYALNGNDKHLIVSVDEHSIFFE